MILKCPKCDSEKIFKRNSVPRIETHRNKMVKGVHREIQVCEPKFYFCVECGNGFNVK